MRKRTDQNDLYFFYGFFPAVGRHAAGLNNIF